MTTDTTTTPEDALFDYDVYVNQAEQNIEYSLGSSIDDHRYLAKAQVYATLALASATMMQALQNTETS